MVNINEPINIDKSLVGRWISISWERKFDINKDASFYTFDAGFIMSYKNDSFQILYEDEHRTYNMKIKRYNWFKSLEKPPTKPSQWWLLSKKVSSASTYLYHRDFALQIPNNVL
jgi:hypothetical protein